MVDDSPKTHPRTGGRRGPRWVFKLNEPWWGLIHAVLGVGMVLVGFAASTIALALTTAATALMVIWTIYYLVWTVPASSWACWRSARC